MKPIYLKLSAPSDKLECGASRFWGNPDLPGNFEYPSYIDEYGEEYHYNFVCQINLEELERAGIPTDLPKKGLLSFFTRIDYYMSDFDAPVEISGSVSDADAVRVLYFPSIEGMVESVLVDDDNEQVSPKELKIDFCPEIPPLSDQHALFASPTHRPWETWESPFEDWKILLQIDSFEGDDFNLNFIDCGVLNFLISPSDLKRQCFDNVRAIVLST